MYRHYHFLCAIVSLAILFQTFIQTTSATEFQILNDAKAYPGGIRFEHEIGVPYTREIMTHITHFILNYILDQKTDADRRPMPVVKLFIQQYDHAEAITVGEQINVSALYLEGYQGNLKWEFTSLLYHEMTHVYQWDGEGKAPNGLVEGVADYTKLKAKYNQVGFAKPGQGDKWDQGYDFTARFLEYCDGLLPGFVAKLNKKMRYTWDEHYFVQLLGKPVNQLWKEYKAKYGQSVGMMGIYCLSCLRFCFRSLK